MILLYYYIIIIKKAKKFHYVYFLYDLTVDITNTDCIIIKQHASGKNSIENKKKIHAKLLRCDELFWAQTLKSQTLKLMFSLCWKFPASVKSSDCCLLQEQIKSLNISTNVERFSPIPASRRWNCWLHCPGGCWNCSSLTNSALLWGTLKNCINKLRAIIQQLITRSTTLWNISQQY